MQMGQILFKKHLTSVPRSCTIIFEITLMICENEVQHIFTIPSSHNRPTNDVMLQSQKNPLTASIQVPP